MTHALGRGTRNLPVNFKSEELQILGRLAFQTTQRDPSKPRVSIGDEIRRLVLLGLERDNPEVALRVREIRNRCASTTLAALLLASVFPWFGLTDVDSAARRSSSTVGIRLTVRNGRRELDEVIL
jgi:hypothetical protein